MSKTAAFKTGDIVSSRYYRIAGAPIDRIPFPDERFRVTGVREGEGCKSGWCVCIEPLRDTTPSPAWPGEFPPSIHPRWRTPADRKARAVTHYDHCWLDAEFLTKT